MLKRRGERERERERERFRINSPFLNIQSTRDNSSEKETRIIK